MFEYAHWIQPKGALSPYFRQPLYPVQKAFRTAGLVRGAKPYSIVVDDIQKDSSIHKYDWTLALESDIQIAKIDRNADGTLDIYLTGADPDHVRGQSEQTSKMRMTQPGKQQKIRECREKRAWNTKGRCAM